MASPATTNEIFGHPGFPEEIALDVFTHLDNHSLLRCAKTCRLLNRLAVQWALECAGPNWDPETYCRLTPKEDSSESPDAFDFLLISVHLKSFSSLSITLSVYESSDLRCAGINRLARLSQFTKTSVDKVSMFRLTLEGLRSSEHYARGSGSDLGTPMEDTMEVLLNSVVSKSCNLLVWSNCPSSTGLFKQYKFNQDSDSSIIESAQGSLESSGSITTDKRRYTSVDFGGSRGSDSHIQSDRQRPFRILKYNHPVGGPSSMDSLDTNIENFRPPFSEWMFSLLENSPNLGTLYLSVYIPLKEPENQFILHRMATAAPAITSISFYIYTRGVFCELVSNLKYFPALSSLTLQGMKAGLDVDELLEEDLIVDLPKLQELITMPLIFRALLSKPTTPGPCLPSLRKVILTASKDDTNQFNLEQFANAVLKARELLGSQEESDGSSLTSPAPASSALPSKIAFGARLRFGSRFTGLLPTIRNGTPPDLGSKALSKALAEFKDLELRFPGNTLENQQGRYKQELMACLTIFPSVEHLVVISATVGDVKVMESPLYDDLVHRFPNLKEAWVY